MKKLLEQVVKSELFFDGKILKVYKDNVLLPDGNQATREYIRHPGAIAVVPVTDEGKIVLVRQHRYPTGQIMLEIPAGKLDEGEEPDACVARELKEETGYSSTKIRKLASVYTTPGFTDEIIHIYVADGLVFTGQNPDADEFVEVEYYTTEQIRQMMADGTICDAKTMLGLFLAGMAK